MAKVDLIKIVTCKETAPDTTRYEVAATFNTPSYWFWTCKHDNGTDEYSHTAGHIIYTSIITIDRADAGIYLED